MGQLSIDNVISVSVSQPGQGIGRYNTSNLAIFTSEVKGGSFGNLGYKIYLSPTEVATDFGTTSKTYKMANSIFSQQPNILAGGGYLVVIPTTAKSVRLTFSATPTSGTFQIVLPGGEVTSAINWNDTAAAVQTKVRARPRFESAVVTGSITSGTGLTVVLNGYESNSGSVTTQNNTLNGGITISPTVLVAGENLDAAITRTLSLIEYFGILSTTLLADSEILAVAAVVQPVQKLYFAIAYDPQYVQPGIGLDLLRTGNFTHSRGLLYATYTTQDAVSPLLMSAAYAGRGLSVDFDGSLTTITMNLKDLIGIQPDLQIDETLKNQCQTAGVDIYPSIQGVPKVLSFGANEFFDDVYNLLWFIGDIKVAGFNTLAQVGTKIPQTEDGIQILKNAYRGVCEQAVFNNFLSPGKWTSPTTFGNQSDLYSNIEQRGYYIYSGPISQQSPAAREAREAPLIQIAIKYAGAVHKSSVVVNINK
jgi:hypothetical protein